MLKFGKLHVNWLFFKLKPTPIYHCTFRFLLILLWPAGLPVVPRLGTFGTELCWTLATRKAQAPDFLQLFSLHDVSLAGAHRKIPSSWNWKLPPSSERFCLKLKTACTHNLITNVSDKDLHIPFCRKVFKICKSKKKSIVWFDRWVCHGIGYCVFALLFSTHLQPAFFLNANYKY